VLELHVDAPPQVLPAGAAFGEIRVIGRPASPAAAIAAVRAARSLSPAGPVSAFSLADLDALQSSELPLDALFDRLRESGLDAVAETPIDRLDNAASLVERARAAGIKVVRLTVDRLTPDGRIALAERARDLQDAVGGFRAFAPLPRILSIGEPTTGYDDVKQVALARMVAVNIESIQVDWPLYGPKLAQVALTVGADDVDGVAAVDTGVLGTRRSPIEEIRGNIRAAALEPIERNGLFEVATPAQS
jgi:aminodeoxyfutalosine synthase